MRMIYYELTNNAGGVGRTLGQTFEEELVTDMHALLFTAYARNSRE